MKFLKLSIFLLIVICPSLSSQEGILLTVNNTNITADEFEWLYQKNNSGDLSTGIVEYLQLYINLRLKVEAAKDAGFQNRKAFHTELNGYRKQLARNYLSDNDIRDKLIRQAYERYKKEIDVYHILVKCPPDATPADTIEAWEKAMTIKERIRMGEAFESVARGSSDDPSILMNGGNIGYLTVFQTPLAFEDAIYSMKTGELSQPVRTSSGYHIIKIQDIRDNQGRMQVAHIMKSVPVGASESERIRAKSEIDSLYSLCTGGFDFGQLASNNSDDMMSASKGGTLPWFSGGQMIHSFSDAAFSLQKNGDISEPVRTFYGWHIIKRINREPFGSFDESLPYLQSMMTQSYLLSVSRKSFADKLRKEYNFKLNNEALEWFYELADSSFRAGNYFGDTEVLPDNILYSFADQVYTMKEFAGYINNYGDQAPGSDSIRFINTLLEQRSYDHLIEYEDSRLEEKYPEFRYLMKEFNDGILYFEISDSLIWKRAVNDTTGLREYYDLRKNEFMSERSVCARIFRLAGDISKRKEKQILRAIRKYYKDIDYRKTIESHAVFSGDTLIKINEGCFTWGESDIVDKVKWARGMHQYRENNGTVLVDIISVNEPLALSFNEVKGKLRSDYQSYLEDKWIGELKNTYTVLINETELEKIKQKYR